MNIMLSAVGYQLSASDSRDAHGCSVGVIDEVARLGCSCFLFTRSTESPDHPVRCSGPNVEVNLADELVLYGDFHNFGRPPAGNLKVV